MALNNVPLSGQSLAITKTPINQNFNLISTAFDKDHIDFQQPNAGKHNQVTFPVNIPTPPNTDTVTLAGELALYNKLVSGVPQLFIRLQNNGIVLNITSSAYNSGVSGYTFLPSGQLIMYGTFLALPGGNNFVYPVVAGVAYANIPFVQLTPYSGGVATYDCYLSVKTNLGFSYFNTAAGNISVDYYAIGT